MAFRQTHQTPGSILTSTKVTVHEPIVNNTAKTVYIEQPKDTIVDNVFLRTVGDITLDDAVDVPFKFGNSSDDDRFVEAATILDGSASTTLPNNSVFKFTIADDDYANPGTPTASTGLLQSDNRVLEATITSGAGDALSTAHGSIEIHVQFRHF